MLFLKKTLVLLLALFSAASFCSCHHKETEYLSVVSTDYVNMEKLEQGFLNEQKFDDVWNDHDFDAYQCFVSKTNRYGDQPERLVVNNARNEHVNICFGGNGYFIGTDYSEFASGIYFFPYTGIESREGGVLPTGRCVALLKSDESDMDSCYAVTSWNYFSPEESVSLYRLDFPTEGSWYRSEKICDIAVEESAIAAINTSSDLIYVATTTHLYAVTVEGYVTQIDTPKEWTSLRVNSLVAIENVLYIGTKYGVLVYSMESSDFSWFPVNYSKIIPNSDP